MDKILLTVLLGLVSSSSAAAADHLGLINSDVGNWTVGNCILASFSMEFTIYPNNTDKNSSSTISVPVNAAVDPNQSNCGNETQNLSLQWRDTAQNGTQLQRNLTMSFHINGTDYGVSRIYGKFILGFWNETISVKNTTTNTTHNETFVRHNILTLDTGDLTQKVMLKTPIRHSYLCVDPGVISLSTHLKVDDNSGPPLGETMKNTTLTAKTVRFDAFRGPHTTPNVMETPLDCNYRPNDFVPIGVGIGLAVLIVFILVAYLIGRRRARQNGYQSV